MKTCVTCHIEKPNNQFKPSRRNSDGYNSECILCYKPKPLGFKRKRGSQHQGKETRTEKPCVRCNITKLLSEFCGNSKSIDGTTGICRECHKKVQNKWYYTKARIERIDKKNEAKLYFANKQGGACLDCGLTPSDEWPMECFDFHHVGEKSFEIARVFNIISKKSMPRLEEEINKCVFLCSNCHRRRHSIKHLANRVR